MMAVECAFSTSLSAICCRMRNGSSSPLSIVTTTASLASMSQSAETSARPDYCSEIAPEAVSDFSATKPCQIIQKPRRILFRDDPACYRGRFRFSPRIVSADYFSRDGTRFFGSSSGGGGGANVRAKFGGGERRHHQRERTLAAAAKQVEKLRGLATVRGALCLGFVSRRSLVG